MRGFSLLELLSVIVIIMLATLISMPMLKHSQSQANRITCTNNLAQIGKALMMYADTPSYNCYPTDTIGARGNPLHSLGMIYRDFVSDYRVFSCAGNPTADELTRLGATIGAAPSSSPLDSSMTHFAYDPGNKGTRFKPHTPNDAMAVVAADFTAAGANSDNHGPHAGQNVLLATGSVEWRDSISNIAASGSPPVIDHDITADFGISDQNWATMESFISQ